MGKEEIYLSGDPTARKKAEKALVSACDEVLAKGHLMVDGQSRGELPGLMAIEPGRPELVVETADGRTLIRRRVNLEAGHTLPLESLFEEQDSGLVWMVGSTYRLGPGRDHFHGLAGDVELLWLDPVRSTAGWRPELHLRATASRGLIPEQADWMVLAGELALGGSLGWRRGGLSLGPVAEMVVPWRQFENESGLQQQGELSMALGGRAIWTHPVGAGRVVLRLDSRVIPFEHDQTRTWLWHQGLAVGWSAD